MASGTDLATHLQNLIPDSYAQLRDSVLPSLLKSVHTIAGHLRTSPSVTQVGTANAFGDDQLNVDVLAEDAIRQAIKDCPSIVTASSEEDPIEKSSESRSSETSEQYTLAFDPLDGSSIIAPNWSVGAILGIWTGPSALHSNPSTQQIASILGVLGPRTTAIIAIRIPGHPPTCFEVGYSSSGSIQVIRPTVQLASPSDTKTRYFAPANLRAAADDAKYMSLITNFIQRKYTLRYSGGLVPDIVHALVKGHGIYISPVTPQSKAKLRRLYELTPIALIIECAGGAALDSATGKRVLDVAVADTDERGGLICGSLEEVEEVRRADRKSVV